LNDTIEQYSNFKDLNRYAELKKKDVASLTDQEKELLEKIANKDALKLFLPK
jgi:hypothetical protein